MFSFHGGIRLARGVGAFDARAARGSGRVQRQHVLLRAVATAARPVRGARSRGRLFRGAHLLSCKVGFAVAGGSPLFLFTACISLEQGCMARGIVVSAQRKHCWGAHTSLLLQK